MPPLSFANDLTRWNRAGLSAFQYVDGNAATYLEMLRQALVVRFPNRWDVLRSGLPEDLGLEPAGDRLKRLVNQYRRERGDWGWEIARALARACHVLTGHLDVYANEGYLGTATQWNNVRRLVEMLDYSPAPPASATALLVLQTKGERGTLEQGFQVQHTPPDGGAPLIFETLGDLEVDPSLDALRPAGWNRSPRAFHEAGSAGLSSLASHRVVDLQGVGPAYARWLDKVCQIETGDPNARFRIGDFRRPVHEELPPFAFALTERPDQPRSVLRLRLRELQGKANLLFDFSWSAAEVRPLLGWTLASLVAAEAADLALHAGRSSGEMSELQHELRQVEIALDQPVFHSARLRDLVAAEGEGSSAVGTVPPPRSPWTAPEKSSISAGDVGLVIRDPGTAEAVVVTVDRVDPLSRAITLGDPPFQQPWRQWTRGETSLSVQARFLRRPRLNGSEIVTFERPQDLNPGEVVAWRDDGVWRFGRVEEAEERALRLAEDPSETQVESRGRFELLPPDRREGSGFLSSRVLPGSGTDVYRTFAVERGENGLLFPVDSEVAARPSNGGFVTLADDESEVVTETVPGGTPVEGDEYRRLKTASVSEIFFVPEDATPVGRVTAVPAGEFTFDGKSGKLASGQWVVADDGETLWPVKIDRISQREDHFLIAFEPSVTPPRGAGGRLVGNLPCTAIQGVGPVTSKALGAAGIHTVAHLHELKPAALVDVDVPSVRLWEIKTKADLLFGLEADPERLEPIAAWKSTDVLASPTEDLAATLSDTHEMAGELQDHCRICEACLIEEVFRELRVFHLLPSQGVTRGGSTGAWSLPERSLPERLVRLYGLFKQTLRPNGWDRNDTPLIGDRIVLDLEEMRGQMPELLSLGRKVVLEREVLPETEDADVPHTGAIETQVERTLGGVEDDSGEAAPAVVLDLASPLVEGDGFTVGNTVLRGNVATVGHGERKPEKVLGSGDAARSNQRFVLAEKNVSFVADATQPSGVRADITVKVEGRTWQQVANLRDAGPADAHYAVRMTEDGYVAVEFGDSRHGRRLPTGGNNVRIGFRVGTGLTGNLGAGSLAKPVRPHRLIRSVRQPLAATGGNDMEDVRSLKENAPASVLTLERGVSVGDLGHLAARQSSVWQARAFTLPTDLSRRDSVEVVVVPAGGGELGDLKSQLQEFLQQHTLPGIDVRISPAEAIPFHVDVTLRIKSAEFDPEQVAEGVRRALLEAFSLQSRGLGQDLFLSEIYKVVEGFRGVESSTCTVDGDKTRRRLDVGDREVFYLDPLDSTIVLRHEEWSL